jgi:nucleotide-binding universal stress UspA family protein
MENFKIVVAYYFRELSEVALKQAYGLAQFVNTGIVLVSVISDDVLLPLEKTTKVTDTTQTEVVKKLEEVGKRASAESGVEVSCRVETGKIYEPILRIAKENKARFIVMGRTSRLTSSKGFGSVAMNVVQRASCPVIIMPANTYITEFKNVVLPIDLSKQTREEVFNAISFGLFYNTCIHLVSVVMGGVAERKSRIYQKMQKMKKTIEENGVTCTEKLFKKSHLSVHEIVLEYSEDTQADALMIMTHQEISTSDTYIGAVANQIIKESNIPVITLTSAAALYKQSEKSTFWFNKLFRLK